MIDMAVALTFEGRTVNRKRSEMSEQFSRIKAHYARHRSQLIARSDEWGIDPYAWEEVGIRLTPIEAALWQDIRASDAVFYPQYPVGGFFVDFGNPAAKVAIECDGEQWHLDKEKDAVRQRSIEALGWAVYRITGKVCMSDTGEYEDEYGDVVITKSEARGLIQMISKRHGIQRGQASVREEPQNVTYSIVSMFEILSQLVP